MKKIIFVIVFALCLAGMAKASEPYGPFPNYKGTQPAGATVIIPTTSDVWLYCLGYTYHIKSHGGQEFHINYTTPVFTDSYVYPIHDPNIDPLILTEIFAYDLQPGLDPNLVPNQGGFNPIMPEILPTQTQGFFEGLSGTKYWVPIETIPVSGLLARLPGYDVSKIGPPPTNKVYLLQGTVPGWDFVERPFDFSYEYKGYITQTNPDWHGPKNPQYPYQHKWELKIKSWSGVNMISDVDIEEPWVIYPGYIEVVPPSNWVGTGVTIGRYGYKANPGSEIHAGGGSLGFDWRVNGKVPAVVPGHVNLTTTQVPVSKIMPTMIVASDANHCPYWGYVDADLNKDCYVNFADLAIFANDWLKCTDPQGQNCTQNTIVGLGLGFNAEDANVPATIGYLLDPASTPGLDVNDIIVEYRGVTIYSGAQLLGVINSLPDLIVGQPVTMTVIKQSTGMSTTVTALARLIPVSGATTALSYHTCITFYRGGWKSCACDNFPENITCGCYYEVSFTPIGGTHFARIYAIKAHCSDSLGNHCDGGWIYLK